MKTAVQKSSPATAQKRSPFFSKNSESGFLRAKSGNEPFFRSRNSIQPKLNIGKSDDRYEKEADAVADKVVQRLAVPETLNSSEKNLQAKPLHNTITPLIQTKCAACEKEDKMQKKEEEDREEPMELQRKPIFESNAEPPEDDLVQRKCEECEKEEKSGIQKKCEHCEEEEKLNVQPKSIFESNRENEDTVQKKGELSFNDLLGAKKEEKANAENNPMLKDPKLLQAKALTNKNSTIVQKSNSSSDHANNLTSTENKLAASKGNGDPMSGVLRRQMESSFGADFSGVRLHHDNSAAEMSKSLNAQAFTHGSDIYFNSNKYNVNSTAGKHLLAHELTHTIQQGKSPGIQNKLSTHSPEIQKKDDDKSDEEKIKAINPIPEGYLSYDGNFKIHLTNFPLKKYEGHTTKIPDKGTKKPKPGERKTRQGKIWRENLTEKINVLLKTLGKNPDENTLISLKLREGKGKSKIEIIADIKTLAKEVTVPFWSKKGVPNIHQIEHVVDWQVLGEKADVIENLLLLDKETNLEQGRLVEESIRTRIINILKHYKEKGIKGNIVTSEYNDVLNNFAVHFETFTQKDIKVKSTVLKPDIESASAENPFSDEHIDVKPAEIPDDHCVIRTSRSGAGYVVKYNFKNDVIQIKGDAKKEALESVTLIKIVKDQAGVIQGNEEKVELSFIKQPAKHYFKLEDRGYAAMLKENLKINYLSPIEFDNEIEVNPITGMQATGKVKPTIPFLENADIDIVLENGLFTINGVITSDALKGKLPKPFNIDSCSLIVSANSKHGLSVSGSVAFSIEKFGKGQVVAGINKSGLFMNGEFNFENKWFDPAQINFDYKKGEWTIGGRIGIPPDKITGVKKAFLDVKYKSGTFSAAGEAQLAVPGIDKVGLNAQFDDKGNFALGATVGLKQLPGIKSGEVNITVKSKEGSDDIKLRVEGKAVPDFPNVPDLSPEISVMYDDGVFDAKAKVNYKKGRFDGIIEIGVTNKIVDDKGQPQGEPQEGNVVVYGFGQLTVDLFKGNKGTVKVRLTPERDVLVAGDITLQNITPFGPGYNFNKKLIDFPRITIPLVGIPGLSISAFIDGSVNFKFNWQPLILKELKIGFKETNIKELETITLDIKGSIGSSASAEIYMEIKAGLEARVLVATLTGALAGQAGLGVTAEAGGELDAAWNMEKGLQFKEVRAFLNVTPKAIFRLTGSISVDLDLWVTTVNLYYHEWVLAEKSLDLSGLTLKLDFPIKFDENNNVIPPDYEKMNVEKPDFSGDAGKKVLDKAINADAEKELEEKKQQIKAKVKHDLRNSTDEDFSPSKYTEKMKKKYKDSPELQEFVVKTIEEESRILEYEQFEAFKTDIKAKNWVLQSKLNMVQIFTMWRYHITEHDVQAFKDELARIEEEKRLQSIAPPPPQAPPTNGATPTTKTAPATNGTATNGTVQTKPINGTGDNTTQSSLNGVTNVMNGQQKPVLQTSTENIIQRAEDDRHDLTSAKLSGNPILEKCFDNETTISRFKNSKGEHVRLLQEALLELGIPLPKFGADEKYGEETEKAVKQFQQAAGMSQPKEWDGIVGRKTINLLDRALRNKKIEGDEDKAEKDFIVSDKKEVEKDEKCKGKAEDEVCGSRLDDIRKAADTALEVVNKVINEQLEPKKTPQADYPAIFNRLFRNNDTRPLKDTVKEVKDNFILIRDFITKLKSPTGPVRCGTECDGGCQNTVAYHSRPSIKNAKGEKVPGPSIITFCPDFPTDADRILIVIHECHHAAVAGSTDKAYQDRRLLDKLDHTKALINAASFHVYAAWVDKPGSEEIGPTIPDTNLISDKNKKDAVNLSIAFLEMWFQLVPFDISQTIKGVSDAAVTGVYKQNNPRVFMEEAFHPWFGLTRPPLRPNKTDIQKLQAIEERVKTMDKAFDKPFVIVETGGASFWERGPAQGIALNEKVLNLDTDHMIIALLQELVHATPDISAEREALYIGVINTIRNLRGMDPS